MLESFVVLAIVSACTLFLRSVNLNLFEYTKSIYSYQIEAMKEMKQVDLSKYTWFNANGNVNHAQTIEYGNKKCVIQLGFGRYRCE